MTEKTLLRAQLKRAWTEAIQKKYEKQLINSENGLQIYFCAALLAEFEKSNVRRRLFIETRLRFSDGSARHPDIVICDTKNIVGIVELKYTPRGRPGQPSLNKDMETLMQAVTDENNLKISNDRYLGETTDKRSFPLAKNAVLCWAGVYKGKEIDLQSKIKNELLRNRFLQLSALTIKDAPPKICLG